MSNKNTNDKKKEIIQKYNSSSFFYDNRYREIQFKKLKYLDEFIKPNHKFNLDAGCGTGLFIDYLLKNQRIDVNASFKYIGVDISLEMLRQFKDKVRDVYFLPKIGLILGDLENLPFRKNRFDLIISLTSFQNLPNINKSINEVSICIKPTGEFILSLLKKKFNLEDLKSKISRCFRIETLINQNSVEDFLFYTKKIEETFNF